MVKIFIDPGHGGTDPGAVGRGNGRQYVEKSLNLDIARRLNDYLTKNFNVTTNMSRTGDTTLSLSQRTREANRVGADYLISIHHNAASAAARGYEDFIYNGLGSGTQTERIRDIIHREVVNRVLNKYNIPNRGRKRANFHMVRESNMPAVLVETLFVSNAQDQDLLSRSEVLQDFAVAYGEGIAKAFGLSRKSGAAAPSNPSTGGSTLYKTQVGAYSNLSNARAMERRLENEGFQAFISSSKGLYRVQTGAFKQIESARRMERALRSKKFPAFVFKV